MVTHSATQSLPDSEPVRIYLGWKYQFQFAGYIVAKELGYYKEMGLNVELVEFDGTAGPITILEGEYDYGVASGVQLIGHAGQDELLVVTHVFQQSPLSLIVKKNSGTDRLKDLEGKSLGVGNEIKAMMLASGVNLDSVRFVTPSSQIHMLETDQMDGNTHYITDVVDTEKEYTIFRPIEYGINFYGECLYTLRSELKDNPDRVLKMKQATLAGWQYAIDHPEETIAMIKNKYNSKKSIEELQLEAAIVINTLILPSFYELGFDDRNKWIHMFKTIARLKGHEIPIDLDQFIFNDDRTQDKSLQKLLNMAGIVGSILIFVLGVLFFYNYQLRKGVKSRTVLLEKANVDIVRKNNLLLEQTQELENLNHFKDRMLSIISHDVKGPLNSIQGLVVFAERDSLTMEEFKEILAHTGDKIREMSAFLDNILYWAKSQLHGIKVNPQPMNLLDISSRTLEVLGFAARNKHITIQNEINESHMVLADRDMTQLILRNLVSNALKFCAQDDVIKITSDRHGDFIKIHVSDTGPGMDEEQLELLFGPDVVSSSGTHEEVGTGLGLLLCKEFVENNEGEIGVTSTLGKGSSFWFTLKSA